MRQSLLGFLILLSFMNGCASMLQKGTPTEPLPGKPGGLTTQEVQSIIRSHLGEIRICYETTAMKENRIGKVRMRFVIDPEGALTLNSPILDEVRSAALTSCMTQKMSAWRFPKPRGGQKVEVSYPFTFSITKSEVAHSAPHQSPPATTSNPQSKGKS